jgi:hypothetical protein
MVGAFPAFPDAPRLDLTPQIRPSRKRSILAALSINIGSQTASGPKHNIRMALTVFDCKGIPATRRELIEATVEGAQAHGGILWVDRNRSVSLGRAYHRAARVRVISGVRY